MRGHGWRRTQTRRIERQLSQSRRDRRLIGLRDQQRARAKVLALRIERLLRGLHMRLPQRIDKRQQPRLPRVRNCIDRARAADLPCRLIQINHRRHRRLQNRSIRQPDSLHIEELRERPARIVVRMLLRIVRRPVLLVQQRIRHPRIRLVQTDNITARGKSLCGRLITVLRRRNRTRHRRR